MTALSDERAGQRWRRCLRLTVVLLGIAFAVTFGVAFFARPLGFRVLGWPLSFWVASQGALGVYLALVGFYAWAMHRLDVEHCVAEDDD